MTERPSLRRIAQTARPQCGGLARGALAGIAATAAATAGPLVVALGTDRGIVGRDMEWVVRAALLYVAVSAVEMLATYLESLRMGRFGQAQMRDVRRSLLDHLMLLDLDFFVRERTGHVVARLTTDVENLQQFLQAGLPLLLRAALTSVFTVGVMLSQSVQLTAAVLVTVSPLVIASEWYRRRSFRAQLAVRDRIAELLTHVNESLNGVRVVQAYTAEEQRRRSFHNVNADTYRAKMQTAAVSVRYLPLVDLLAPATLAVVVGYGVHLVAAGTITIGTVLAFSLYAGHLFAPIQQFADLAHLTQSASASFTKVFAFLDEKPAIVDADDAAPFIPRGGEVVVDGVAFRYPTARTDVFADLTLTIRAGERVALVGPSGAGKSTLAKLVARFCDPTAGHILIDGQDLRAVATASLRRAVILLPQDAFLFDGTIADNIELARPGATRDQIEGACRSAGILDHLATLTDGLDTRVSGGGTSLSAGQRQMVAIAQAFMADPQVLILDESTSSLDPRTAAVIEEAAARLLHGRTAIIIAHRMATALRADRIVVVRAGRILDDGPPAALAASGRLSVAWKLADTP